MCSWQHEFPRWATLSQLVLSNTAFVYVNAFVYVKFRFNL